MLQEERIEEDCIYRGLKHENMQQWSASFSTEFLVGGWFFPLKRDDSMIELLGQVAQCLGKIRKRGGIEAILI